MGLLRMRRAAGCKLSVGGGILFFVCVLTFYRWAQGLIAAGLLGWLAFGVWVLGSLTNQTIYCIWSVLYNDKLSRILPLRMCPGRRRASKMYPMVPPGRISSLALFYTLARSNEVDGGNLCGKALRDPRAYLIMSWAIDSI